MRSLFVALIVAYQRLLSPFFGGSCRFYPSCSQYAKEVVLKYGCLRGFILMMGRIMRCNPWSSGGIDPAP